MTYTSPVPWEGAKRPPRVWQAEALLRALEALREGTPGVFSVVTGGGKSVLQAEVCRICLPKAIETGGAIVVLVPSVHLVEQMAATMAAWCGAENVGCYYTGQKQHATPIVVCCNKSLPSLIVEFAFSKRRTRLLIVDECHGSESATLKDAIPALNARWMLGFTATPFRSDARQSLGLFTKIIYSYTYDQARADGVLVPYDAINCINGETIGDTNEACADLIAQYAHGPGVVMCKDIADAIAYADFLTARGIPAAAIHNDVPKAERTRLIERLRVGEIRALCQVRLLVEGVDYPWLRWGCLRIPLAARVKFIQFIGRFLRVCTPYEPWYGEDLALWGPKHSATIIDPYRLLESLGLSHPEALGRAMEEEAEKAARKAFKDLTKAEIAAKLAELPLPNAVDHATGWAQRMAAAMRVAGMAAEYIAVERNTSGPPSLKQLDYLRRLKFFTRYLPEQQREIVKLLIERVDGLSWGAASDLISILRALKDASANDRAAKRHYKLPGEVLDGVEAPDEIVVAKLAADSKARSKAQGVTA